MNVHCRQHVPQRESVPTLIMRDCFVSDGLLESLTMLPVGHGRLAQHIELHPVPPHLMMTGN